MCGEGVLLPGRGGPSHHRPFSAVDHVFFPTVATAFDIHQPIHQPNAAIVAATDAAESMHSYVRIFSSESGRQRAPPRVLRGYRRELARAGRRSSG